MPAADADVSSHVGRAEGASLGTSAKGKSFFKNSRLGLPKRSKYWVKSLKTVLGGEE